MDAFSSFMNSHQKEILFKNLKNNNFKNKSLFVRNYKFLCSKFALKFFKKLFLSRKTEGIDPMTSWQPVTLE